MKSLCPRTTPMKEINEKIPQDFVIPQVLNRQHIPECKSSHSL